MKVAIYVRVSTEEQAKEGFSISAQKQRLLDYASSQGWKVVESFIDDGYSAKDLNRPNVQKMIKGIEKKQFDVVLVYRLDRLVRSVVDLHNLLKLLEKHDCKFKSATEMFDTTTAMGRFFITLVGAMAEWERENLGERTLMGMTRKHEEGQRNGGRPPYGYDYIDGELVVNEEESKTVKYIFDESEIKGAKTIAVSLNKNGLRTKQGSLWSVTTITLLLTNPIYYGMLRWNYVSKGKRTYEETLIPGTHEPIITKEQFDRVQDIRKKRAINRGKGNVIYPFSGVLKCKRCGNKLTGSSRRYASGKVYRFYKCATATNNGVCDLPSFGEQSMDEVFIKNLNLAQIDMEVPEQQTIDIKMIEKELKKLNEQSDRIDQLFIMAGKSKKWYMEQMESIKKRETELTQLLHSQSDTITPEELKQIINSLKSNWSDISYDHRKKLIQSLFDYIEVDFAESLDITDYSLK